MSDHTIVVIWVIKMFAFCIVLLCIPDFPCGSDGKASSYNAGDPGSIPGSGSSPGEGNGNPSETVYEMVVCDWSSDVCSSDLAQMVKRLPTMWETQVRSLGQEDPLEKEMETHSSTDRKSVV